MSEISAIKDNVWKMLAEDPDTRGSDELLIFKYFVKHSKDPEIRSVFANVLYILGRERIMFRLPPFETIRRVRQKIQEGPNGAFKPEPDVVAKRMQKRAEYLAWVRSQNELSPSGTQ